MKTIRLKWTLIPTVIAALNTAAIAFNVYHFSNEQLQSINEVVSVIGLMIGVVVNHVEPK